MKDFRKIFLIIIVLLILFLVVYFAVVKYITSTDTDYIKKKPLFIESIKNGTYEIDGVKVTLKDGISEMEIAPGSSSKMVTKYFGNEAVGDLDGDGAPDVAFLLTQNNGGSGTFYYVVAALWDGDGYLGTSAVMLGDRIAPQTTEIRNSPNPRDSGTLIVNYAIRKTGEPMTAKPSVTVSRYFLTKDERLMEFRK